MTDTHTIREVMERLNCSRATVVRMLNDKQLTRVMVRRSVRIPVAEVDALIKGKQPRRKTA